MTVNRISGKHVATWIGANYLNPVGHAVVCVAFPPVIPDAPDEIVVVTLGAGSGFINEKAFEVRTFQVRCRAKQNNPDRSEANSLGIDTLLNSLMMPWEPDGCHVMDLGWVGGGPFPMPADDEANRYSWVCTYFCRAATGF